MKNSVVPSLYDRRRACWCFDGEWQFDPVARVTYCGECKGVPRDHVLEEGNP